MVIMRWRTAGAFVQRLAPFVILMDWPTGYSLLGAGLSLIFVGLASPLEVFATPTKSSLIYLCIA